MMGLVSNKNRKRDHRSFFLLCAETVRKQLSISEQGVLTRNLIYQHLDLGLLAFRTVNICCLRHSVCGILLQQPKLTRMLIRCFWYRAWDS